MHQVRISAAGLLPIAVLVASCTNQPPRPPSTHATGPVVVSAAASTKEVVEAIGAEFTKSSGIDVKVNAGPSNALASQILAGAPADLFLSANAKWVDEVEQGGLAAEKVRLLTNHLVIV